MTSPMTTLAAALAAYRLNARHRPLRLKEKVLDDPDLVFFKRAMPPDMDSPVIPFYWGFREVGTASRTVNGQKTDRNGNRLDKDLSKGGGLFGNATSSLPDMWNRGVYAPMDPAGDPLRPVKTGPGRLYMVLAARRLAALISMIRQYEPNDTVNIVAHSQGCLISLLAQALLLEMGERTADTLILTHPPYSLDEKMGVVLGTATFFQGDKDPAMEGFYHLISGKQSVNARLQMLVNIVAGIAKSKATTPVFGRISEMDSCGMVQGRWKPDADRDNRGKVYLYFSPEDMTVALDNMRGIGWQGVPDTIEDTRNTASTAISTFTSISDEASFETTRAMMKPTRKALSELGLGFRQRVFTAKIRPAPGSGKAAPVLVGQSPHDFVLRVQGEDDHAHVTAAAVRCVSRCQRPHATARSGMASEQSMANRSRYLVKPISVAIKSTPGRFRHIPWPRASRIRIAGLARKLTLLMPLSHSPVTAACKSGPRIYQHRPAHRSRVEGQAT